MLVNDTPADGLAVFVKKECPTCRLIQPIIRDLAKRTDSIVVFAQDDVSAVEGLNVITEEFADAFEVQRRAIGFDAAAVVVPHPMQNRTRAELEGFADQFCQEILARICS